MEGRDPQPTPGLELGSAQMSVRVYDDQELAALWLQLGGAEPVMFALHALAIANRAAYMLTYAPEHEDACTISVPQFSALRAARDGGSTPDSARNLLYNCISNGGTDFAPRKHAATLMGVVGARAARRAPDSW